jgi:hypothetical protein
MIVKVPVDDNKWDPGLNGCFVMLEHQCLLCWTHCLTEHRTSLGTWRMSWPHRVSEVGPCSVLALGHGKNLACQHRINSCWLQIGTRKSQKKITNLHSHNCKQVGMQTSSTALNTSCFTNCPRVNDVSCLQFYITMARAVFCICMYIYTSLQKFITREERLSGLQIVCLL